MSHPQSLRLGILGTPDALETIYLPTLQTLSTHFTLTSLYSSNLQTLQRCQKHHNIPNITTTPADILNHPDIDLILNLLPFEYHEQYTVAAVEAGKHVMVEIPLSLSIQGFRRIREATKKGLAARSSSGSASGSEDTNKTLHSGPPKVFVGCARRYAPCFTEIFKKELASLDRVYYARSRNIGGPINIPAITQAPSHLDKPNGSTINELNGMNGSNGGVGINDLTSPTSFHRILDEIFGSDDDITPDRAAFCRFLGTLGCHDLSLMRETLGFPDAVSSVSITDPFYSTIFHYTDDSVVDGHPFTLVYEAGVDSVPRCDAHLSVYGARKNVSVEFDFPFPGEAAKRERFVRVVVEETVMGEVVDGDGANGNGVAHHGDGNGHGNGNGVACSRVKRSEYVSSEEEAYEAEFRALHAYLTGDESEAKTTSEDALDDLRLLQMIFGHYERQCGTIRTPLG